MEPLRFYIQKKGMRSTMNPRKNFLQSSIRSKQRARNIPGIKWRQCHGGCKHLKGPWKRIYVGGWYGYHREPRSWKYQEKGLKVGTQRYDKYGSWGWRAFLATQTLLGSCQRPKVILCKRMNDHWKPWLVQSCMQVWSNFGHFIPTP
jgi:hypothetical protein